MTRRLILTLLPLVMACNGELFAYEQPDERWCSTDWMCNIHSGAVASQDSGGRCAEGLVPAICLYYGDTDASDKDVYCHHPELFADSCKYEAVCHWDEEAEYFVVECS